MAVVSGWEHDQEFERNWWGDCLLTFGEETKQLTYAHRMGLEIVPWGGQWPVYDLDGRSVLDIGGGPVSMLLKTVNGGDRLVVDPCDYPGWVQVRYLSAGIGYRRCSGEAMNDEGAIVSGFDEVWIYNCLQHTQDPETIIDNALAAAPVLRMFEWIDIPAHEGHPHELKAALLDEWVGGVGTVERMNENGCVGTAWYGKFSS